MLSRSVYVYISIYDGHVMAMPSYPVPISFGITLFFLTLSRRQSLLVRRTVGPSMLWGLGMLTSGIRLAIVSLPSLYVAACSLPRLPSIFCQLVLLSSVACPVYSRPEVLQRSSSLTVICGFLAL